MRTIGILLLASGIAFTGCNKKTQELPVRSGTDRNIKTVDFSVTSDSSSFTIPITMFSGATEIEAQGQLITSLSPGFSSYVILMVGDSVVWHASFMDSSVDFNTRNLKSLIRNSGLPCRLEFYNVDAVHGPFKCTGTITYSIPG
jgi:hypothetical protein